MLSLKLPTLFLSTAVSAVCFADFEGKVRAVAFDRDVKVRVVSLDSTDTKLIKICESSGVAGETRSQAKLAVLRAALEQQATIRVKFNDMFESCLENVELVEEVASQGQSTSLSGLRPAAAQPL